MHRSGTSALMGVLRALSIEMGSNLMVPSPQNPKGYFELLDIVKLNDSILNNLHSSWDSPYALSENWWKGSELSEYRTEIFQVIKAHFEHSDIISIKDPRLCRLLPLWSEIFEELKIKPHFIIPLRNPLEIANSLKNRDGFSLEKSLLLWMIYMLDAEFFSRNYPRVFITYDSLLKDTSDTISNISRTLNIEFPKSYQDAGEDIARFLDVDLKHHNQDIAVEDKILLDEILNYYFLLSRFVGREEITEDELSEINNIRERYYSLNRLFYNKDLMAGKELKENIVAEKDRAIAKIIAKYESRLIYIPLFKKLERSFRKKVLRPALDIFQKGDR
jgi:hypothetical protein